VGPDILLILVVLLVIVIIWRGPKMLPKLGEAFGKTIKGVKENVPGALKGDSSGSTEVAEVAEVAEVTDTSDTSDTSDKSGS
jgi:Sec-independent protein translocase protein TatA